MIHVVKQGETLFSISEKYFRTGRLWRYIYSVNKDIIEDPNIIEVGQELKIPSLINLV